MKTHALEDSVDSSYVGLFLSLNIIVLVVVPVSEMTYTVSSGTLKPTILYYTIGGGSFLYRQFDSRAVYSNYTQKKNPCTTMKACSRYTKFVHNCIKRCS